MNTKLQQERLERRSPPLVSIILPCYNEEALLEENVTQIVNYIETIEEPYEWEILIINDGSKDATGTIADQLASRFNIVHALHHPTNFGVGQAMRFGIANTKGDYVITLDVDLSYDVNHISEFLQKIKETHAKVVLASPYMEGGVIRNVPFVRRLLSVMGNRFLKIFVRGKFSTLTSIARAYDGPFVRSLKLRSIGLDLMPEALYKSMMANARIVEVAGRLDWGPQLAHADTRSSSMRLFKHINSTIMSGFVFSPVVFFIFPGLLIGLFALYVDYWMFAHFFDALGELHQTTGKTSFEGAFAMAYQKSPHTFFTALMSTTLAIQLLGLGMLAMQNTRYFEDLYNLSSSNPKQLQITPLGNRE